MTSFHRLSSRLITPSVFVAVPWVRQNTSQQTSKSASTLASNHLNSELHNTYSHHFRRLSPQHRYLSASSSDATKVVSKNDSAVKTMNFMKIYEKHLELSPVKTKMITGGLLWSIGDAVAQVIPALVFGNSSENNEDSSKTSSFEYDYPRTCRAAFFGFCIHAPTAHLHYNFLESLTIRSGFTGLGIPVFKAFMEQFVYWSWLSNSLYHGAMGAMQGKTTQQIYDRIADVLWDTQKAQWVFWIPVQLLNFRFVPVRHQLNVVLITSIVWTALLSVWYPPENDEEAKDEEEQTKIKAAK